MRRSRYLPGEAGIWVLVGLDVAVFGSLLLVYAWQGAGAAARRSVELSEADRHLGLINTLILLTSSWLLAMAIARARGREPAAARRLAQAAMGLGVAFVGIKVYEYAEKLSAGRFPSSTVFLNFYFSITGLHLFHVVIGLGVLLWLQGKVVTAASEKDFRYMECGGIYWHMVDIIWIVIFPLVYLL